MASILGWVDLQSIHLWHNWTSLTGGKLSCQDALTHPSLRLFMRCRRVPSERDGLYSPKICTNSSQRGRTAGIVSRAVPLWGHGSLHTHTQAGFGLFLRLEHLTCSHPLRSENCMLSPPRALRDQDYLAFQTGFPTRKMMVLAARQHVTYSRPGKQGHDGSKPRGIERICCSAPAFLH